MICVSQLFTLSVRLPVNSRLQVIKFQGVKSYMWIFDCTRGWRSNRHVVQGRLYSCLISLLTLAASFLEVLLAAPFGAPNGGSRHRDQGLVVGCICPIAEPQAVEWRRGCPIAEPQAVEWRRGMHL